jgi:multidrug transporter EmrE-like cation transporter
MNLFRLLSYVFPTVVFVVYSQLIIKWRLPALGRLPDLTPEKAIFFFKALFDPFICSGVVAAFLGSLAWMAVVSKIPLNVGFPVYYGLTFAFVVLGSILLLNEQLTPLKIVGVSLILVGVVVGSLG